jgi:hypothetical protein
VIDRPFVDGTSSSGYQLTKYHLSEGKIIGGTWWQYPHCNLPVLEDSTIPRRSWIVYLDYRTICSSYQNRVVPPHHQEEEQQQNPKEECATTI